MRTLAVCALTSTGACANDANWNSCEHGTADQGQCERFCDRADAPLPAWCRTYVDDESRFAMPNNGDAGPTPEGDADSPADASPDASPDAAVDAADVDSAPALDGSCEDAGTAGCPCDPSDSGESSVCGDRSCSSVTRECTTTARGSLFSCQACASDEECHSDESGTRRCVPLSVGASELGTYCLLERETTPDGQCPNRFRIPLTDRSLGGVDGLYCAPDESAATCEAVLDHGRECEEDADCAGADGELAGLCRAQRCTYRCRTDPDCPDGLGCVEGASPSHCCPGPDFAGCGH